MTLATLLATLLSGGLIGLILGLVGGGGSILAVPLLIYAVQIGSAHAAIGTAAVAVAVNALIGLAGHARAGTVKWPCAGVFAFAGVIGAAIGAEAGKAVDGARLLTLFGLLMIGVGFTMLLRRNRPEHADVRLSAETAAHLLPRLVPAGLGVGLAAGFFGIGGGFLIVPALIAATGMPVRFAVGTSLVVVTALGLTTAASYALSGYVDWTLVALLTAGGVAGALPGIRLGRQLATRRGLLEQLFAILVILVGGYIALRGM
ncbi:MAG TPA: sulfite exporter TauE/SafE family protein [Sphingobium sp.]|nr:sulfite exporter TauE/SafE family protein [Sphingobium sp.]